MKRALLAVLLFAPAVAWAEKPNSSEYTTTIHVTSSVTVNECQDRPCYLQRLQVLIDGKKYEIDGAVNISNVLKTGDYSAKVLSDKSKQPYEYQRTYQVLFPDGTTRDYYVAGESE